MKNPKQIVKEIHDTLALCSCEFQCINSNIVVVYVHMINRYMSMCRTYYKKNYSRDYECVALIGFTEEYVLINQIHES